MGLPDISFENIRAFDGSRHSGFEELCSQLALLEAAPVGSKFFRKGRGGDAGVECYLKQANGAEVGWQAKYLFSWDGGLASQLDDSIRTALDKHPKLVEYVVCLPFDLSDSRTGKGKTARQKWDDWCAKWRKVVAKERRNLTFTLWGRTELVARLTKDNPAYSGRLLYWFNREAFTTAWFEEQFGKTRVSLGTRYTPDTNIELPIRQDFLAFARDPSLQKRIDEWFLRLSDEGNTAINSIRDATVEPENHSGPLEEALRSLTTLLGVDPIEPHQCFPLDSWASATATCLSLARAALRWTYDLPPTKPAKSGSSPERWAQHNLQRLAGVLYEIADSLSSRHWQLANARAVLLQGPAGIGKSHLLADIAEHEIHEGRPALVVLGSAFVDGEPWRQILTQLDRPPSEQVKHFLGALDAAAQATNTRAIICIDALNERNGLDIWPHRLAAFLKTAETFPRVGVVLSCRSTYVSYVIPDSLGENQLFRITHEGFAADGGEAAKIYLDKRGIIRPGAPNLVPEFENPLFLKTCCDFLEKEGKTELPRGLRGVTSIFGFYNEAVNRSLDRRMKLDPHLNIVPRAIASFAQLLADAGRGYALKSEVIDLLESIRPSNGQIEKSLLSQLESEGLLAVEPVRRDDSIVEMVRFTFERFSDHAIAKRLLDDHLNVNDAASSFREGQPLHDFVFSSESYERAGIIEAMAIQLPERAGVEILDVGYESSWGMRQAFLESLLWREQSHFTDRTYKLAERLLGRAELNDLLISISTEPTNKFNASFVHEHLISMPMPQRDALWSVHLAQRGFEGPIETLISWAISNGLENIEEDRAYLAATILTWFFTTPSRIIRDKATKGLACILADRLPLATRLVGDFADVNDVYVRERLLAACYGAALQGTEKPGLDDLARAIFDKVFADGKPPADALLRDHAQGIVEYAAWRGVLNSSIDIALARPPFQSAWPIEPVPDEIIESYTEDRGRGVFRDAIVGSTGEHGDFARYQIDHKLDKWSPATLGTNPLPTSLDVFKSWTEGFSSAATAQQLQALKAYLAAAKDAKDIHGYQRTPETDRLAAAEKAFKEILTSDQWEDFRVRAQGFMRHQLFGSWRERGAAIFNIAWGRRWICKRAHTLGWTSDLFSEFDNSRSHGRTDHQIERVGKKYQWLALRELVARMADNLAYLGESWDRNGGEPPAYRSARQVRLRDIDPSLLTSGTHYDGWAQWSRTWWVPFNPQLRSVSPRERRAWLESNADIINDASLIDLRNPKTGRRWLALWGFSNWRGYGVREGRKGMQRDTWFRLNCIVVRRKDQTKMIESLRERILTDPHALPKIEFYSSDFYLGECPWHPEARNFDQWSVGDGWRSFAAPCRPTVASYTCERGNYDHSIDRTVSIEIPTPWLADALKLRLASGQSPIYTDSDDKEIFFDPSVLEAGPAAALIDRDAFLKMLDREGLSAVWIIAGKKQFLVEATIS